jgi:hypothetical protein
LLFEQRHSRSKNGVASLARSRSKNGVASLAYGAVPSNIVSDGNARLEQERSRQHGTTGLHSAVRERPLPLSF